MEANEKAVNLGKKLQDYKGRDVVVLDFTEKSMFTDYFVIATSTSNAHASSLEKRICEEAKKLGLEELKKIRKMSDGDEWKLIDFGIIVVHIMSETARKFYDLEKLWYDAECLFKEA